MRRFEIFLLEIILTFMVLNIVMFLYNGVQSYYSDKKLIETNKYVSNYIKDELINIEQ